MALERGFEAPQEAAFEIVSVGVACLSGTVTITKKLEGSVMVQPVLAGAIKTQ